jgi:MFS family permease
MAPLEAELPPPPDVRMKIKDVWKAPETKEILAFFTTQFLSFAIYMSIRQLFPLYLQERTSFQLVNYAFFMSMSDFKPSNLEEFTSGIETAVLVKWGIIATAYTFAGLVGRIPSGWLVEKFGRKISIVTSYSLMIISLGFLMLTDNTAFLAILFIFLRLTNNVFGLCSRSLLADMKSKYKGLYNSLISSFGRLGTLIGAISLGFVLDFFPGYIMILCGFIVGFFALGIFLLLFVKGEAETHHFIRRVDIKKGEKKKLDFQIFKSRTFIFFTLCFIVFGFVSGITDPIISLYGKNILFLSERMIGTIIGLSQLSFVLLSPFIGWIISSKPKSNRGLLIGAAFTIMLNYLLIYLIPYNPFVYAAILFIKNIGHALFIPVVFTILTYELPKAHFSVIYAVITTGFFVGITSTTYLSTYLYNISPVYPWLFAWIMGAVLIGIVLFYVVFRKAEWSSNEE